jgi:hypothetical protein
MKESNTMTDVNQEDAALEAATEAELENTLKKARIAFVKAEEAIDEAQQASIGAYNAACGAPEVYADVFEAVYLKATCDTLKAAFTNNYIDIETYKATA